MKLSYVRSLSADSCVRSIAIVEVLPFAEFDVEHVGVVDHDTLKLSLVLLGIDLVASLDFPIESRRGRFDVDVTDAAVDLMPVEVAPEL